MTEYEGRRAVTGKTLTRRGLVALSRKEEPFALVGCSLAGVDASRLALPGWMFHECGMERTRLDGACLEGARFIACKGPFAGFTGCDLVDTVFSGCDFNNSRFRRARLGSARFERCKLTGADFTDVHALGMTFEDALLVCARLPGRSFVKAHLRRIDFSEADLRKCDFRDAVFEECSLRDAVLPDCRFDGADLRGADLGGLTPGDAHVFRGAIISPEQAVALLGRLGLTVI